MPQPDSEWKVDVQYTELDRLLHGDSSNSQGLAAMSKKDFKLHDAVLKEYSKYFGKDLTEDESLGGDTMRTDDYYTMAKYFYNLVTDFYEYGWGRSFHFCRFSYKEPFSKAIARHEHSLAHRIGIKEGMTVLDVGCGVAGPAIEIAKFTDARIVGLNINEYHIEKATGYVKQHGLTDRVSFVHSDFMQMKLPDNSFDAAYVIEATAHAPSLEGAYREIFRVLKPGSIVGIYEWVLTNRYDPNDLAHREIALALQQFNGIAKLFTVSEATRAIQAVGFQLLDHEDLADRPTAMPWYHPFTNSIFNTQTWSDVITYAPMSRWGRTLTHYLTGCLEMVRLLPRGTQRLGDDLSQAGENLVVGGEAKLFSPMYFMLAKKPEVDSS
ncbi:hypothetical protein AJ80_02349 [Polytolypa hystricis UAMH7299]|uniref:SAM-dependent methyltransferase Erg6/SMT-type domain-containing protein n=1 Tax=Polytolypa hystricis (strain UAMH7299) TaxID=1447883 RepID=A0A2B7YRA4_POLH7|nr:hypothetical protein AJ80_02349 [Polytolypa hystricis UAMH7299]